MKVAVIGAGMAGICCAYQLAKTGNQVTLIEKKHELSAQGSGILIQPIGLAALDKLGIREEIESLGHKINKVDGRSTPSLRQTLSVDYQVLKNINYALGVSRTALWTILMQKASSVGIKLISGVNIVSINNEKNDMVSIIDVTGKQYIDYELVVDASGTNSSLNQYAIRPAEKRVLDYGSFWTKVEMPSESIFNNKQMVLLSDKHNVGIGIMPIGKEDKNSKPMVALFFNVKWQDYLDWDEQSFQTWRKELIAKWPETAHLVMQLDNKDQLYLAKFNQYTLPMPYANRVVFIGDAAHSAPPQLGLGVNMSLIEGLLLSSVVNESEEINAALKKYASIRFKHVVFYQTLAKLLTPFYQSDIHSLVGVRDFLYGLLSKLFMMKTVTAFLVSGQLFNPLKHLKR